MSLYVYTRFIAVKAQMNLRLRKYSRGCGAKLPRKDEFYIVRGVFCSACYNSFTEVNYFTKLSLELDDLFSV